MKEFYQCRVIYGLLLNNSVRAGAYARACVCAILLNDDCSHDLLYTLAKGMAACVRKMDVSMLHKQYCDSEFCDCLMCF